MIKEINSLNNNLIIETSKLKQKKYRIENQLFLVEGYHLVQEALKHQLLIKVFSTDKAVLEEIPLEEKYLISDNILKKLSDTVNPQNIIGVAKLPKKMSIQEVLKIENPHLLLLDDIADPGNLGTIIRTAAALDYDAIICSENTVDYFNDKVVRSSQGSIFKISLFRENLTEIIPLLKKENITVYGSSLQSSLSIEQVKKSNKCALVLGNEAHGISEEVSNSTDYNIILPMKKDVESLNVSIASAILMWEFKK